MTLLKRRDQTIDNDKAAELLHHINEVFNAIKTITDHLAHLPVDWVFQDWWNVIAVDGIDEVTCKKAVLELIAANRLVSGDDLEDVWKWTKKVVDE